MASRTAYSTWTPQKPTLFDGHYLRNRSTLDIGVLGYISIVQHKELSPEVLSIPPGTLCIYARKITVLILITDSNRHRKGFKVFYLPQKMYAVKLYPQLCCNGTL